jgi:general secretion pathway protein K
MMPRASRPPGPASSRGQRGVALITALLVVVLATVAAVSMTSRQHLDIRRAGNVLNQDQAWLTVQAAERYALKLLTGPEAEGDRDLPWEGCLSPVLRVNLADTEMDIWVEDMHCRFNLNNLSSGNELAVNGFIRLLENLRTEYPELAFDPEQVVAAARDWMNPETDDPVYRLADPPYLSANRMMMVAGEMRLVHGVSAELWEALAPLVTALPAAGTQLDTENAADMLREAFPATGAAQTRATYYRLGVHAELAGRRLLMCSLLDTASGRVVWRLQGACDA